MVRVPSRASTCFARDLRLRGQNRVPLPPARITGANRNSDLLPSLGIHLHLSGKRPRRKVRPRPRPSNQLVSQALQSTPASASHLHPLHRVKPHTTAGYAHSFQTPRPAPPPHVPRSAASRPGP